MSNVETMNAYRKAREAARKFRKLARDSQPGTVAAKAYVQAANTAAARASEYAWQIQHTNS